MATRNPVSIVPLRKEEDETAKQKEAKKRVRADPMSHVMSLGVQEYLDGNGKVKPIIIIGWVLFKDKVKVDQVKSVVKDKLLPQVHRMQSVPVIVDGWTHWEPVDDLDDTYHFESHAGFETEQEWDAFVETIVEEGLDYTKPFWKYIVIDKLPCGRSAVMEVMDHAMGDGASGVSSLLHMSESKGLNPVFVSSHKEEAANKSPKQPPARALTWYEKVIYSTKGFLNPLRETLHPGDTKTKFKQPKEYPPTGYHFGSTPRKDYISASEIKAIKRNVPGATFNDVLLTVIALSVREYFRKIEDPIMNTTDDIHGTFVANVRPRTVSYLADEWFGNHFVVQTLKLPLHLSPAEMLLDIRNQTRFLKSSPDAYVRNSLTKLLTKLPKEAMVQACVDANTKFSIMLSNVLFSMDELTLFGQEVDDVRFFTAAPVGLYAGVSTYADKVSFCLTTSKDTGVNPNDLVPILHDQCQVLRDDVLAKDHAFFAEKDRAPRTGLFLFIAATALVAAFAVFLQQ